MSPVSSVLHHTRASCAAKRSAEELCGGAGTSSPRDDVGLGSTPRTPGRGLPLRPGIVVDPSQRRRHGASGKPRSSRGRRFGAALLALLLMVTASACGRTAAASSDTDDTSLRFEDAQPTLEALGRHVLVSLTRQDTLALNRVRLTEHEHNEVVWPELPASAPEVNFPVDYAWSNIQNRNNRGMSRLLPLFADRSATFQRVECRGGVEAFETFSVLTDCFLVFSVDAGPELWEAQLFKDVLVRGGGYKLFRYYDEEARRYRGVPGGAS